MDSPIFLVSLHPKDERLMEDFAAIDFETANGARTSVCSVGVVVVRRGEITERFYSLIQPEPNYYSWFCQRVHGLDHSDTDGAPLFPEVWNNIADDDFKDDILNNARSSLFSTEYIDTVTLNKLDEETFCEYLAHEIVP